MNATTPAPITVSSTRDVAHIAWFRTDDEWIAAFESGTPVLSYCGVERTPRPDANGLPVCPECKRRSQGHIYPAPLGW